MWVVTIQHTMYWKCIGLNLILADKIKPFTLQVQIVSVLFLFLAKAYFDSIQTFLICVYNIKN